jgi:2-keto-4-pentenoate hydratase/2-oxohepta-3-ene-1,7-dioic acid hydratase in catechol pathway
VAEATPVERLARILDDRGRYRLARVEGDQVVPLVGDLFGDHEPIEAPLPLQSVTLLPPVVPSKVVGIGSNYRAHVEEMGRALPAVPKVFLKPSTAVIGPGAPIRLPAASQRVDHEAELGVVIGRTTVDVSPAEALEHVLGYTCVNDVTARDLQRADTVFGRAKGFDSFCPLGPWIATGLDPSDLRVRGWVDGELRQDGRSSDLVFDVPTLISFVSRIMTLHPGDVIATGTPAGVGPLRPGEVVRVEVEGVGWLENPVEERAGPGEAPA